MTWHEYFKQLAITTSLKSKDPRTKVGAVITDKDNRVVSLGYNGFPAGMQENDIMWEPDQKKIYVIHAEANALLYARKNLTECSLYVTLSPCHECMKLVAASGIKTVYFVEDRFDARARLVAQMCDIKLKEL